MSIKKFDDKDLFENVVDIVVRMYGNGHPYERETIRDLCEICRNELRRYFLEHNRFALASKAKRLSFIDTLVYRNRHRKACLKRLKQFLQAKERPSPQQDELIDKIVKDKKLTLDERFNRICTRLNIQFDKKIDTYRYDKQRFRQYSRLDQYYKSDELTSTEYISFVERQQTSFNQIRSLSSIDVLQWLNLNQLNLVNQEIRLAEICLFVIKEILLNLMDQVYLSSKSCQISDVFRRKHVLKHRRLPYSGRRQTMLN